MKSLMKMVCGNSASRSRKPVDHRSLWCLFAMALVGSLLVAIPAFADCASGSTCTVVIGGTQYVVVGPCDYSTLGTSISGCLVISSGPAPSGPPLCVGGAIPCPNPNNIVQDPAAQLVAQGFEQDAREHIAALRVIPDGTLNALWSRGEIRAYMYLHLLGMANAPAGTLSAQDQAVVDYYQSAINAERLAVATKALSLYNSWTANPCAFKVPVGDPDAYLNQQATQFACLPGSTNECAIVNCVVPPISADQFNAWAAGFILQNEMNGWGQLLVAGPYIGLTLPQAQKAVGFEYDAAFGGIEEGIGFLTAHHARIANIASDAQIAAQSDLQAQWLEGLHEFAGERLVEAMQGAIVETALSEFADGSEATLAEIFGITVAEEAVEEGVLGTAAASWDTFVAPAIAAVAVVAVESWEIANADGVQPQLQAAVCAVTTTATNGCPGTNAETLQQYAQDSNGRQLILDALIKSTMPDFIVARLTDPTYGTAPSAGPVLASDPTFMGGANTPASSFTSTDWSGSTGTTSVANGWFVLSANTSNGPGPQHYTSNIPYLTPNAISSSGGGTITITPVNVEQWRAWLDGNNFLAQRAGIQVGFGHVEDAVNACPTVIVGGSGNILPTAIDLGNICVKLSSGPSSFPIQKGDEIVIGGQVRTAAGNSFLNASDSTYYVQTTEPFANPVPADGTITVLVHPDGNCLTSSALGSRVSTPDCTFGPTINTDRGPVTIVSPTPAATFSLSGLGSITLGGPSFNVSSFFVSNSSGVVTFTLAPRSVGCAVTSDGTVTITGAAAGTSSCIIIASQAATDIFAAAAPLSGSFHINQATPTVSVTGGTFTYNGNQEFATGFAYGLGGTGDIQTPAVTFSYAGVSPTVYPASATAPIGAGTYQVTASFSGNDNYKPAFGTAAMTIGKATATIAFTTGTLSQVYNGQLKTVATTTNPAGLSSVQLSFTGTPLTVASYPVIATLNNPNYQGSIAGTLVITQAKPAVTFTGAPASAALGAKFVVTAGTNSTATAVLAATGACSISGNTVTMTSNSGTCQMTSTWPADTNYIGASASQSTVTAGVQITSLLTVINGFKLSPGGSMSSFTTQLQQVMTDLQGAGNGQACSDLKIFVSHVKAQTLKQLTAAQAQQMLTGAAQIAATVGCL
jgi:hypothetical protein